MPKSNDGSKKPQDSDFYQQRLKAWQPMLTPKWVVITFLLIGIPFVIIGFVLKAASDRVVEYKVQYDGAGTAAALAACHVNASSPLLVNPCTISITVDKDMSAPVYLYYELTNFYQNHRRYVKSKSDNQLAGEIVTDKSKLSDCDPLRTDPSGRIYHPCGLIAASFFNDTITLDSSSVPSVDFVDTGIAWDSDRTKKFAVPANWPAINSTYAATINFLPNVYINNTDNTGYKVNEHFIVWMRAAALPDFRKLYGRFDMDIPAGTVLSFEVDSLYPVTSFDGTKSLVLSTVSFMGGKNPFLGIAYIVVGFTCIALALLFAIKQYFGGRRLGDTAYLVWDSRNKR